MSNASLYHRINELVEEVRTLKAVNEKLREMNTRLYNAALHESDKLLTATDKLKKVKEGNTRLANENSSLKFAAQASSVVGGFPEVALIGGLLSCGGTVAE